MSGTKLCTRHYELIENEYEEFSTGNQFEESCDFCGDLWTHWLTTSHENLKDVLEIEMCQSCGYQTKNVKFYESSGNSGYLCEICSCTQAGNAFHYPNQFENIKIMQQISFIGNMILDEIRNK